MVKVSSLLMGKNYQWEKEVIEGKNKIILLRTLSSNSSVWRAWLSLQSSGF